MVMPVVVSGSQFFYWNLSANVGLGCPNRIDDVQLVQLGYALALETSWDNVVFDAEMRSICKKIIPGQPYSGVANDPLTLAIVAHQKKQKIAPDGHVSVLPPMSSGVYQKHGTNHVFLLVRLVNAIKEMTPEYFPRIDLHPKCPLALKSAVRKCCVFSD
jgi:hypothetical protein